MRCRGQPRRLAAVRSSGWRSIRGGFRSTTACVRASFATLGARQRACGSLLASRSAPPSLRTRDQLRVLGRDAQDTQRLARRWRLLAYKDPPRSAPIGRLEEVEHEALATPMAAQAGVGVPGVVAVELGPDDAIVVTREPDVTPLELLDGDTWSGRRSKTCAAGRATPRRRHRAREAQRAQRDPRRRPPERPVTCRGDARRSQSALDIDVAELLVACCVLVGPERALSRPSTRWSERRARAAVSPASGPDAAPPPTARTHEVDAWRSFEPTRRPPARTGSEIAPARAGCGKDVLLMASLVLAAYLLMSQLAEIGLRNDRRRASAVQSLVWVVVALPLAQSALIGSGISVRGAVPAAPALAVRRSPGGDQVRRT